MMDFPLTKDKNGQNFKIHNCEKLLKRKMLRKLIGKKFQTKCKLEDIPRRASNVEKDG